MNCQEARGKIPDLLNDGLAAAEASRLREHLLSCPSCREEFQELSETWARLGILPEVQPGPELRRNFYRQLELELRETAAALRPAWRQWFRFLPNLRLSAPVLRLVAPALVVIAVFASGFFLGNGQKDGSGQIQRLSREKDNLQQQFSLALLTQPSASARLQGLSLTSRLQDPDPALLKTLLAMLDEDPSVNVRLSAVDALYLFADREEVRAAITASLARQTSPLVQIALIDLMVALKEKRAAAALKKLVDDGQILPEVRQRAQSGISHIL
ncbi:MAG: HEAT repeat domain-containing protein [Candidatus Aminicenantes bacterium]|nr:HEAT repeat domain-containing protein [Candidatus Aminicenantes bacterium]